MGNNDNRVVTWKALNSFITENGGTPLKATGATSLALRKDEFPSYAPMYNGTTAGIVISDYTGIGGGAYANNQLVIEKDVTWRAADTPTVINPTSVTILDIRVKVGQTATVLYTVEPNNATNKSTSFTITDTSKATVSGTTVTGVAVGTTTITGTTINGITGSANVTIYEDATPVVGSTVLYGSFDHDRTDDPTYDYAGGTSNQTLTPNIEFTVQYSESGATKNVDVDIRSLDDNGEPTNFHAEGDSETDYEFKVSQISGPSGYATIAPSSIPSGKLISDMSYLDGSYHGYCSFGKIFIHCLPNNTDSDITLVFKTTCDEPGFEERNNTITIILKAKEEEPTDVVLTYIADDDAAGVMYRNHDLHEWRPIDSSHLMWLTLNGDGSEGSVIWLKANDGYEITGVTSTWDGEAPIVQDATYTEFAEDDREYGEWGQVYTLGIVSSGTITINTRPATPDTFTIKTNVTDGVGIFYNKNKIAVFNALIHDGKSVWRNPNTTLIPDGIVYGDISTDYDTTGSETSDGQYIGTVQNAARILNAGHESGLYVLSDPIPLNGFITINQE